MPVSVSRTSRDTAVVELDKWGVKPGNLGATNTNNIANVIEKIKNSSIKHSHLKLSRAGTFLLNRGTDALHEQLKSAILLPSNCKFELGQNTELKPSDGQQTYVVRNDDPVNGNTDIEICGGILNGNRTGNGAPGAPGLYTGVNALSPYYGFISRWENIKRFHHHSQYVIDAVIWAFNLVRGEDCWVHNIVFDVARDGYHLHDCRRVTLSDMSGTCLDNFIAISTGEGGYWSNNFIYNDGTGDLVDGDLSDIVVRNIQADASNGPIRLFGFVNRTIDRITVDGLYGSTTGTSIGGVQIINDSFGGGVLGCKFRGITIKDIKIVTKPGEPQIVLGSDTIEDVTISDVTAFDGRGIHIGGTGYKNIKIDNIKNPGTSTDHLVSLGPGTTPCEANHISITNIAASPASGSGELIQIGQNADIDDLFIDNLHFSGVTTSGVIKKYGTSRQRIRLGNAYFDGANFGHFHGPLDVFGGNVVCKSGSYLGVGGCQLNLDSLRLTPGSTFMARMNGANSRSITKEMTNTYIIDYTEVQVEATIRQIVFDPLPRGAFITGIKMSVETAFAGNSTSCHIRNSSGGAQIGDQIDCTVATDRPIISADFTPVSWARNQTPSIRAHFVSGFGNLSSLTAGKLLVYVDYIVLGVNH